MGLSPCHMWLQGAPGPSVNLLQKAKPGPQVASHLPLSWICAAHETGCITVPGTQACWARLLLNKNS